MVEWVTNFSSSKIPIFRDSIPGLIASILIGFDRCLIFKTIQMLVVYCFMGYCLLSVVAYACRQAIASEWYLVSAESLREVMLMGQAAPCNPTARWASVKAVSAL